MDDGDIFIFDSFPSPERRIVNNNYDFSSVGDFSHFHDIIEESSASAHGASFEELELELEKREKELFLCRELGAFLINEYEELLSQQKNLINDHTRILLDLQSYEASKNSLLDLAESRSEFDDTISSLSCFSPESELSSEAHFLRRKFEERGRTVSDNTDFLSRYQPQFDDLHPGQGLQKPPGKPSSSDSHTEIQSIADSTFTAFTSVSKNLQTDLDKLQRAHELITRLEVELDTTRASYRQLMNEYSRKLKDTSQSLGSCVDKARPYFDAVQKARKAQYETQQAAMQYKRAVNLQKAGRDMVRVAEERLTSSTDKFDTTWQEMLNQATLKVNEAAREKDRIHDLHMKATKIFKNAEEERNKYQETLQRSIVRAKPYFELQHDFQGKLGGTTKKLNMLEVKLLEARQSYSDALSSIRSSGEGSSDALDSLAERGVGVGEENPLSDISALPKPMQDLLRQEPNASTALSTEEVVDPNAESIMKKSRFSYNPYDLMYLNDVGSDSGSAAPGNGDEYITDF